MCCCIEERSIDTNEDGSSIIGAERKPPGRRSVVSYTISADVHDRSSVVNAVRHWSVAQI